MPGTPQNPLDPLPLSPVLIPSPVSLPRTTERDRRRRREPPQPLASPRLPVVPRSSASSSATSSPSHTSRSAPWSRRRRQIRLRPPWTLAGDSGATGHPRPRCAALRDRGELRRRSPLFSLPFPCRSTAPHHGRSLSPPSMSPSPSRPASAQTEHPIALPVPRGCRRAPQVASPCPAARSRSRPNSGRRRELCSGELRPSPLLPPVPPDAREPGLRPGALRRRPRGLWRGLRRVQRSPAASPVA